jgi:hypothetical protein
LHNTYCSSSQREAECSSEDNFLQHGNSPYQLTILFCAQSPLQDVMAITFKKRAVTFRTVQVHWMRLSIADVIRITATGH